MIRRAVLLATAIQMAGAGSVLANHFPPLSQIKVGAKLALYQPEILLLLAVCGLAISYWGRRDALIGFAAFLAGVLLGFPVVFIWQIDMVWLALILTLLFGATVALHLFLPKRMQQAYLVLAGACCAPLAFIGHYYQETTWLLLGNFVFTLLLVMAAAYLVCAVMRKRSEQYWWMAIVLRVFGSWASAAAIMVFAFYLIRPAA